MLKKCLSSLMILIILILFTLTWYSAHKTEELLTEQIEDFNHRAQPLIEMTLDSYQRHLLTSTARTSVTTSAGTIRLAHQIRHFIWGPKITTVMEGSSDIHAINVRGDALENFQLVTQISFDGSMKGTFKTPQNHFKFSQGSLELSGSTWQWFPKKESATGTFEFHSASFIWETAQERLEINDFSILSSGNGEFAFPTRATTMRFSRMTLGNEELRQGQLTLEISGIDRATLNKIGHRVGQLYQQFTGPQTMPATDQLELFNLYRQLLEAGAKIRVDPLSVNMKEGSIKASGVLILKPTEDILGSLVSLSNVETDLFLTIDQPAFQNVYRLINKDHEKSADKLNTEADRIIDQWVQRGLLMQQAGDKRYKFDFSLKQGQASLNGNPHPLY